MKTAPAGAVQCRPSAQRRLRRRRLAALARPAPSNARVPGSGMLAVTLPPEPVPGVPLIEGGSPKRAVAPHSAPLAAADDGSKGGHTSIASIAGAAAIVQEIPAGMGHQIHVDGEGLAGGEGSQAEVLGVGTPVIAGDTGVVGATEIEATLDENDAIAAVHAQMFLAAGDGAAVQGQGQDVLGHPAAAGRAGQDRRSTRRSR